MFIPFDDTLTVPAPSTTNTKSNYDTSAFDAYRQGVEIITNHHLFGTSQPKLWSGNTALSESHQVEIITYGQALDFIAGNPFGLKAKFEDLPIFNPVAYIQLGSNYPLPIVFNDGPMQAVEAQMEPITIPNRIVPTNEGPFYAHAVRAELEDGNNFDSIYKYSSRIQQFIDYAQPIVTRPFLDQGGVTMGTVYIDQWSSPVQRLIFPYDDTRQQSLPLTLTNQSSSFQRAVQQLQINFDNDFRPVGERSAPAGYTYYGPTAAGSAPGGIQCGTDSITFGGWSLGS